jgi:hypothetical protein
MSVNGIRAVGPVPILGQPCQVHGWFPTIMLTCTCRPAPKPLMLVGLAGYATCPDCHQRFALKALTHDGATGNGSVNLVAIGKASDEGQA